MLKRTLAVAAFSSLIFILRFSHAQAPKSLKFQSTWPASLTLQDNLEYSPSASTSSPRGALKIEALAAGQIVPAFEVLDATNKKVIDGGHGIPYYWVGKNKTATLFSGDARRPVRHGPLRLPRLDVRGRRHGSVLGVLPRRAEAQRDRLSVARSSPQAFGWFKRPIKNLADFKGMKCRQTGIVRRGLPEHGHGRRSTCRAARSSRRRSAA